MKKKLIFSLLFLLLACKNNSPYIIQKFPEDQNLKRKQYAGNMFGNKDGIIISKNNNNIKDKIYADKQILWNRAIYFISNILPIAIIDENSGLISTDWGNIKDISGNNDLYKINIVIKGKEINIDNILISVFKKNKNGDNIKDKIVAKIILDKIVDL